MAGKHVDERYFPSSYGGYAWFRGSGDGAAWIGHDGPGCSASVEQ